MTRSKKTRNPGSAPSSLRKSDKAALADVKEKRIRKKNGNKPGTRQNIKDVNADSSKSNVAKDPRIGSKKPIELIKTTPKEKKVSKLAVSKSADIAQVRKVTTQEPDLYQELARIEEDEKLQEILAKQEEEIALSEEEVNYFNKLMSRHEVIREELGLDDEDEEQNDDSSTGDLSEDDLWNKFNSSDFEGDEEL